MKSVNLFRKRLWRTFRIDGEVYVKQGIHWGMLFNPHAWWIGVHYSQYNKRYCINLIPFLTVWVAYPDGTAP